jgi:plasmid stabilization system protein ParE
VSGYVLGKDAEFDLGEIWDYIAEDNIVIYCAERRPIEIVAVTQGSRDIPAFLRRRTRN